MFSVLCGWRGHISTGSDLKSYYFAEIPRVIPETNNFFLTAEQLKDGMIAPSISGNYDYRYFDGAVVVVFSNNPPPTYILSKDKW